MSRQSRDLLEEKYWNVLVGSSPWKRWVFPFLCKCTYRDPWWQQCEDCGIMNISWCILHQSKWPDWATGESGPHCTLLSKQGQRREKTLAQNPDHQGYPPAPTPLCIYLNFRGWAGVLQGHLSPHLFPSLTPTNSTQPQRCRWGPFKYVHP